MLAALPSRLYIPGALRGGSRCRRKAAAGRGLSQPFGTALPTALGHNAMQSILDETQDVELLLATALTAAGYVIGAAVFLAALL